MEAEKLKCQWENCKEVYWDPELLYAHLTNDHVGRKSTGNLCLTCHWDSCGVSVVKRDHITSHLRVHVPLKPHCCQICHKAFKRPQDLKKHERTHIEERRKSKLSGIVESQSMSPPGWEQPLSPPRSTHSVISPQTDLSDTFQSQDHGSFVFSPDYRHPQQQAHPQQAQPQPQQHTQPSFHELSPDQFIADLIFPMDMDTTPEYQSGLVDRLDYLQSLVDTGTITPENLNIGIQNDKQMEDVNNWLSKLDDCLDGSNPPFQQMVASQQPSNFASFAPNCTPPAMVAPENIYPQDIYVRSHPVPPPPTSQNMSYLDPQAVNPYATVTMPMAGYTMFETTGERRHQLPMQTVDTTVYQPQLLTSLNYTSANDDSKPAKAQDDTQPPPTSTPSTAKEEVDNAKTQSQSQTHDEAVHFLARDLTDLVLEHSTPSPLYPTVSHSASSSTSTSRSCKMETDRHRALLRQLGSWIRDSYQSKKNQDPLSTDYLSPSSLVRADA